MTDHTRIPVDSAEAAELRENETERSSLSAVRHLDVCRSGWLGEDTEGRPIPCPLCRPHLWLQECTTCTNTKTSCDTRRTNHGSRCCRTCHHQAPPTLEALIDSSSSTPR